jgi:adenylosuccinate synthase
MSVTAVVGGQWGDEGKGRFVDELSADVDWVVRSHGGDNAGHMVYWGGRKWGLHMVPSGIFQPRPKCLIGAGCVVNPSALKKELDELGAVGIDTTRVFIDRRAHVVMPWHPLVDRAGDRTNKIGTTGRGIGPAYSDKSARTGVRIADIINGGPHLHAKVQAGVERANEFISGFKDYPLNFYDVWAEVEGWADVLRPRIVDSVPLLRDALERGGRVLVEGQLGIMRDLDWGTYPFVTSSNSMVSGVGAGLPVQSITRSLGVVKAYTTAVGAGPFPTEEAGELGNMLRELGAEYGVTTGRPRRCGWFDAVSVRYGAWLSGYTDLAVTKLDVLDGLDEVKICTAYEFDGRKTTEMPDVPDLDRCRPVYEVFPGWKTSTRNCRTWADLPPAAQSFICRIEELSGVRVSYVSVGPERGELIRLT